MNNHAALYALAPSCWAPSASNSDDFAMQWQPVPDGIPMRTPLAYLSGALLSSAAAPCCSRKWSAPAHCCSPWIYGLWTVVALHRACSATPASHRVEWHRRDRVPHRGAVALYRRPRRQRRTVRVGAADGRGLCAHVRLRAFPLRRLHGQLRAGVDTANSHFWAWATGAGHLAAGLALVSGVQARLAATLPAVMMASFVVLLHIPRVIAARRNTRSGSCWPSRVHSPERPGSSESTRLERRPAQTAASDRCAAHPAVADALTGVIESFVLREGTDYGERDVPFETKVMQVRRQLERREAEIVFDPSTETIGIVVRKPEATEHPYQSLGQGGCAGAITGDCRCLSPFLESFHESQRASLRARRDLARRRRHLVSRFRPAMAAGARGVPAANAARFCERCAADRGRRRDPEQKRRASGRVGAGVCLRPVAADPARSNRDVEARRLRHLEWRR